MGYYQTAPIPKPEISAVRRKRRDLRDRQAERLCRAAVKLRDKGRCVVPACGKYGAHMHHIVYRSQSKALRWATSNNCLLCTDHHRLEHASEITIEGDADVALLVTGDVDTLKKVRA